MTGAAASARALEPPRVDEMPAAEDASAMEIKRATEPARGLAAEAPPQVEHATTWKDPTGEAASLLPHGHPS
jgi:hypothetical protein